MKGNIINTTYNHSLPTTGISGSLHASAAEARASFDLARMGIIKCDEYYPATFYDADGKPYNARSDFKHEASGVRFEFKCTPRLNGLRSLASAASAQARLRKEEVAGFVNAGNRQKRMLDTAWSESVHKQAGVVKALTAAQVVLVRATEPDEKEHRRLLKHRIFYRTMQNLSAFAFFLKMASMGFAVSFYTDDHEFSVVRAEI